MNTVFQHFAVTLDEDSQVLSSGAAADRCASPLQAALWQDLRHEALMLINLVGKYASAPVRGIVANMVLDQWDDGDGGLLVFSADEGRGAELSALLNFLHGSIDVSVRDGNVRFRGPIFVSLKKRA